MSVPKPCLACLLFALILPITDAQSDTPALLVPPPPSPATQYVRDLLILDAAAALKAEAGKTELGTPRHLAAHPPGYFLSSDSNPSSLFNEHSSQATDIRLKAIVGVGRRLSAMLDIDGQAIVYRAGKTTPVSGPDTGIRLVKIAAPCVEMLLGDGQPATRCMNE